MAMVVDAFVGKCIEKLLNLAEEKVVMMLGVKGELTKLQRRMQNLSPYLEDAEGKIFKDKSIGSWLGNLKDIVYDADDIIDLCRVEGTKLLDNHTPPTTTATSVCCYCPSISCFTGIKLRHEIGNKIQELNNRLEEIAKDTAILSRLESKKSVPSVHTVDYRQTSHLQPESDIVGADIKEATHHLVNSLVDKKDGRKLNVFGIVGMGGIGKTTLARKVFNHASIVDHFPSRVWLCVSKTFSGTDLLKQVIRGVNGQCGEATSRAELDGILASALSKKLFLVLDDVWGPAVWEDLLRSPLECGDASVQVLITTRHAVVARAMGASIHYVEKMNDHDGWVLLCKKVFGDCDDKEIMPGLKDIGIEVIKKCDGLPLAIKVIAGILRSKKKTVNDWKKVLLSSAWSITELPEELRGSLYLSYEDLRSELKQCFLFCSLYPEDHTIDCDELIRFWVAEGFIRADGDIIMEDLAEDYYSQLIDRSLLQPVGSQSCNIHDLLRSLAQFLIGQENICLAGNASTLNASIIRKLRRLSFEKTSESTIMPFAIKEQRSLRTMIFFGSPHWQILLENNIFTVLSCLRVLDLSDTSIESLPDSVGTLVHLRLLDLSSTKITKLPESMGTLVNLQTLNLHECENLNTLPKDITRISSLKCLVVHKTGLRHMPKGICQLKELNCLKGFIVGDDGIYGINGWTIGCNIEELENLSKLRQLSIYYLERASTDTPPETGLQHNYSKLPPLGQLPQLKSLDINGAYAIVTVGSEFLGCHAFPKLETLAFNEMKNWEEWLLDGSGATSELFPCLTEIQLYNCPKLRYLPTGLGHVTCLHELSITESHSLIEVKNLPLLAKLYVDGCGDLQRISDLPLLAELTIYKCHGLQRISDLPLLAKLTVEYCDGLQRIFDLPLLAILSVERCGGLQRISDLPLLAELTIYNCGGLQRISDLPLLAKLTVEYCDGLQRISDLPLLAELTIYKCHGLQKISDLPLLAKLTVEYCDGLQRISDLPLLAELTIYNCGGLQRISDLPLLAILSVERCGGLQRISDLPLLAELIVYDCGGLQRISDLPLLGNLKILGCNSLMHVANLDALRSLYLRLEYDAECLPEWLAGLEEQQLKISSVLHDTPPTTSTSTSTAMLQPPPLHLHLECYNPFLLRRCLKGGEDWHIIHKFPQVTITAVYVDGEESMMYTRTPPTYTTNLHTEKELEDMMAKWASLRSDINEEGEEIMEDDDINEEG